MDQWALVDKVKVDYLYCRVRLQLHNQKILSHYVCINAWLHERESVCLTHSPSAADTPGCHNRG